MSPSYLAQLPWWISRWLGHRELNPPAVPKSLVWFWSFIGAFCGISVLQAVFGHAHYFINRDAPSIVASFVRSFWSPPYPIELCTQMPLS